MIGSNKKNTKELQEKLLSLEAENKDLKYELESYKWQMDEISKQEEEIKLLHQNTRKLKHDMRNHLMVVTSYINNADYQSAKNYISEILDKLNAVRSYVETGNPLINHILNAKLEMATLEGIDVKVEVGKASFDKMKGVDFSAVFSNAIDNAIEHERIEPKKELVIKVFEKKGYDAFTVKNRISNSVLDINPELKSNKPESDQHGFGVRQIRDIVDAYEGLSDFYEEDGMFIVNVFIPK